MKLFLFLITFVACIFGFFLLNQSDIPVEILLPGYSISTSLFFLTTQILILILIIEILLFFFHKVISMPYLLYQRYLTSKNRRDIANIFSALLNALLGDRAAAIKIARKYTSSENIDYKKCSFAIMSLSPSEQDRIYYLHELSLIDEKFKYLVHKKMAIEFLSQQNYHEAAFHGNIAFLDNEHDPELYLALIEIYLKTLYTERAIFVLEKAERNYPEAIKSSKQEISALLFTCAENLVAKNDYPHAILCLEKVISYNPENNTAVDLLLMLKNQCS